MSYNVKSLASFERQAKPLLKKYPSLKKELVALVESLKVEPNQGTALGKNCFKVRLAIASKGSGKSGGARIISHLVVKDAVVYLVSMYNKADVDNISDKELNEFLKQVK